MQNTSFFPAVFIKLCSNQKVQSMRSTKLLRFILASAVNMLGYFLWWNSFLTHIDLSSAASRSLRTAPYYHKTEAMCWSWALVQPPAGESMPMWEWLGSFSALCGVYSILLFLIYLLSTDMLPCPWFGSWNLDSYPSNRVYSSLSAFSFFSSSVGSPAVLCQQEWLIFIIAYFCRWKIILQPPSPMATRVFTQLWFPFCTKVCFAWKFRFVRHFILLTISCQEHGLLG